MHFFDTMDFVAPLVPPGLGFGRIGNFIGGELWGKYTERRLGRDLPAAPTRTCWRCSSIRPSCRLRSCMPARWIASRAILRSSTRRCWKAW